MAETRLLKKIESQLKDQDKKLERLSTRMDQTDKTLAGIQEVLNSIATTQKLLLHRSNRSTDLPSPDSEEVQSPRQRPLRYGKVDFPRFNGDDKKPNDQAAHINLKVNSQDGNEVFFRIKRDTQLKKLMNAHCDAQSVPMNMIAFIFDGRPLRAEQTPDQLEMEDGDVIYTMLHQRGGMALT